MNSIEYYHQGVKLVQEKDYAAAIEVFNTALNEYPDDFMLLEGRVFVYGLQKNKEKALADYTRMIAVDPKRPDGWNGRGNLYCDIGEYDKAIADYTQCIPLSPDGYGTYWSNRGIAYYKKGDLDTALADLNKSIESWGDPECSSWALLHRGIVWRNKGELDKALADFMLISSYEPEGSDALYHTGYIWFMREDYEQAIAYFSKAIEIRDDIVDYWLARGVCYWNKCVKNKTNFWNEEGEIIDLAINDFTKVIEYSPDMTKAYFNRGVAYCAKARDSHSLIKSIVMQKVTDDAQRVLLLTQLERLGGKNLIPQFDAILRLLRSNRDQADVLMAESLGLFVNDDAQEAVEDLSRVVALEPNNAEAYYYRGLAYALLQKKDNALSDYEQTCALNPDHVKAATKRDELLESQK
ncbi:MAG: tetratricopeptide repeat protein [Treponema sp.]|jgi:tetratricopeptide (TPR) repeat protein|nr:tetratricopeptide repeat protein [Treponema sp.]